MKRKSALVQYCRIWCFALQTTKTCYLKASGMILQSSNSFDWSCLHLSSSSPQCSFIVFSLSSTPLTIALIGILWGNLSDPFLSPWLCPRLPHTAISRWQRDRSIIACEECRIHSWAPGRVCARPRAKDHEHVSCCASNVPPLQMLLICRLMCFLRVSGRCWVRPACDPIRAELIREICKQRRKRGSLWWRSGISSQVRGAVSYCESLVVILCCRPSLARVLRNCDHRWGCRDFRQDILCAKITTDLLTNTHTLMDFLTFVFDRRALMCVLSHVWCVEATSSN